MKSGLIAINLAAILFGTAALYGKLDVSAVWIVAMRGVFACVTLVLLDVFKNRKIFIPEKIHRRALILTGILLSLHWLTFFISVKLSGIAIATLTFATFPLFTVILSSFMTKKSPTILEILAGVVIIVAVGLLMNVDSAGSILTGTLVGLFSAVLFAVFGLKSKALTGALNSLSVSLFQNLVVFLSVLPFLFISLPMPKTGNEWLSLALLGVVGTALMHQLYLFALARLSAKTCSGFVALEPVYAICFSAVIFQEEISVKTLISGGLIFASSFVLMYADKKVTASCGELK